jgi:hypothetical protein
MYYVVCSLFGWLRVVDLASAVLFGRQLSNLNYKLLSAINTQLKILNINY